VWQFALYLTQRMMVVPKHVQQAAIISAIILVTKMLEIFCLWAIEKKFSA